MSIQHVQGLSDALSITGQRQAPEALQFWLNLIQDISAEQELELPFDAWNKQKSSGDLEADLIGAENKVISALPPLTQRYLRLDRDRLVKQDLWESNERYESLQAALSVFRAIARRKGALTIKLTNSAGLVGLRVDERGEVRLVPSQVFEAFQGVEADRIRECENLKCRRIFWAARSDQPCCSKKCANVRRVQRWRDKYQDVYKQNRIAKQQTHEAERERERRETSRRGKLPRKGR